MDEPAKGLVLQTVIAVVIIVAFAVFVIFEDADIERAAAAAPLAVFGNAGQDCCARSRILVERSALDRFMQAFEKAVPPPPARGGRVGERGVTLWARAAGRR